MFLCERCGLPVEDPKLATDGTCFYCRDCASLCHKCDGEGEYDDGKVCPNCSGTGKEPLLDPEADIFG